MGYLFPWLQLEFLFLSVLNLQLKICGTIYSMVPKYSSHVALVRNFDVSALLPQ